MKILIIALNTFREAVRNKVLYTLLFFSVVFSAFSISLSTLVLGEYTHMLTNAGLAIIEIFGTLIAIFVGINLVYKELQLRTIYTIITRPIRRYQFILGKYLGLMATLFVQVLLMTAIFFAILLLFDGQERIPLLLPAIWLIFMKLAVVTAFAVLFSSISTPILSGMFTLGFYVIGSTSGYLPMLINPAESPSAATLIRCLNFLLPDFRFLDVKAQVVYKQAVELGYLFQSSAYALFYLAILLVLSILIFEQRDMK